MKTEKNVKGNVGNNLKSDVKDDMAGSVPEKKKNPFITILFVFVLLILVVFSFHYFTKPVDETITYQYNDFHFAKLDNGLWSVAIEDYMDAYGMPFILVVHMLPKDVENIEVKGDLSSFFPSNETYLSYDPAIWERNVELKVALMDLSLKLAGSAIVLQSNSTVLNPKIICSLESEGEICLDIGRVGCEENGFKVISFTESNTSSIAINGDCITLSAKKGEFLHVVDRLIYDWFGIMDA